MNQSPAGTGIRTFLRKSFTFAVIRVVSTFLLFFHSLLLARLLGTTGFGIFSYATAITGILALFLQLGLPRFVIQETARCHTTGEWGLMRGLWIWSIRLCGTLSLLAAAAVTGYGLLFPDSFTGAELLVTGSLLIPLMVLNNAGFMAPLSGLRLVIRGQLPEQLIRPCTGLMLIPVVMLVLTPGQPLTPQQAISITVISWAIALATCAYSLWQQTPASLRTARPVQNRRLWLAAGLSLMLVHVMDNAPGYIGTILLGLFRQAEEAGIFRVVLLASGLTGLAGGSAVMIAAPQISALHAAGKHQELRHLCILIASISLVFALAFLIVFIMAGEELLAWAFGAEYASGRDALVIMIAGRAAGALNGPGALLLVATGHRKILVRCMIPGALTNICLGITLVPFLGVTGAAVANAAENVLRAILTRRAIRRKTGLDPSPLSARADILRLYRK